MKTVLLHCCCAPCSLSCVAPLRAEGIEPVAFWYNPNIHPWKEYQARRDCLLEYAPTIGMEIRVRELGFYMQKYCGCVFSEQDRYQKQIDRDGVKFAEA